MVTRSPRASSATTLGQQRRVWRLAGPIIGENLLQTLLGLVDTLLVARLGAAAIAGVGTSLSVMFFLVAILSAIAIGSNILVAHAVGAHDRPGASRLARQSLAWGLILAVPMTALGVPLSHPLLAGFGLAPDVAQIAGDYVQVITLNSVFLIQMFVAAAVLRGAGNSRTPMRTMFVANLVNAGAAYLLIFGPFGLPAFGAVGSAWAASLGRAIATGLLWWALWRGRGLLNIRGRWGWRPDWSVARRILGLGVPAALEQGLVSSAFLTQTIIAATLGTASVAAHRLAFNALSVAFLPGIGFGLAATALVGQRLGARRPDEARAAVGIAARWAVLWMGAMGALYFLFAGPILRFFTDDPAVVGPGIEALHIIALVQPLWGLSFAFAGGIRGTGNTHWPLIVNGLGIWASMALAAWFVLGGCLGLAFVWAPMLLTSPITAALNAWRFRQRNWETVHIGLPSSRPPASEKEQAAPAPP